MSSNLNLEPMEDSNKSVNPDDVIQHIKLILDDDDTPREVRHAFEEVILRNVTAIKDFTQETRKIQRNLEIQMNTLQNQVIMYKTLADELRKQLSLVQAKLYQYGTS